MLIEIETEIDVNSLATINVIIKFTKESRTLDELYFMTKELGQQENIMVGKGGNHVWVAYQDNNERILKITE
jgi:uncharacterized protein (DUF1697 family)